MDTAARHAELTQSGLNLIAQAISIFDADLRLAVANQPFADLFALPDDLTRPGTSFEAIIRHMVERGEYGPQPDPEAAIRLRVDQARHFQPHYLERTRPDGRVISVEGAPLAQGGWIAVYTDITQIKAQEALLRARASEASEQLLAHAERLSAANRQLAATNAALAEAQRIASASEARVREITGMVPAHIAHMDRDYNYTFSNRQIGAVFPSAGPDVVGLPGDQVLGSDTFARIRPHMDAAMDGQPQVFEITDAPSGRRIRIALTPDGTGSGVYILSTDVTAEVQSRETIAQTARRSLAAQMTSGLAHDFGNLLTIILGLQGRLAAADLPPEAAADVAATLAAAQRGAALLDRINDLTAPHHDHMQPVDLSALLDGLAAMARPSLGAGITLELHAELPPGQVMLDDGALQDTLLNLLLNARDAMGDSGRITLTARLFGDWLEIRVKDTGPGFSEAALKRGLEPFFTTKGGQGSGLGLATVYDSVKAAGGLIRLDNGPAGSGIGARVRLLLPYRPVKPRLILLAEDDPDIRATTRKMLTAMGHAVIEAASLAEAQALADLPDLSAILSDLQLGDGSGADLAGGLPLLLMTALPANAPERATLPAPVLQKPLDTGRLALALNELFHD
ncbi:MAG: PAS-domain containing protein [Paracoccus sp. (in: a-proteobacteria)]|uniref:hybrid sensor histidine kinase/response regulator n=1 Tax=Paracoccus sp. TaxID=267 RepID=UPI0026E067E4|nr:PAS-domain containing protein [Paracoccus sp. (in: a-proteobacteria)]MDO5620931.1 PAS-domain containing protein [Paracoccus sp. (in: a-proteobacteria)]